ncbi:hypothetical protein Tco_0152362 [Tanacetum coccineum]
MPRDCLESFESMSKVSINSSIQNRIGCQRWSASTSPSTSTPGISSEVAELKDMVKALLLDKKNQSPAPTPVKAVEESCVTCGGAHSYQTCPATSGNVYRDNIQEYVSQAAAANYNQGNTGYRAPISNQIRPPGFPPVQNNHVQNQGNNQNRYNQNRGNFNQAPAYQSSVNQGQIYRPQVVQPPAPQTYGVSKTDFDSYVKANDAVMRNMQTQGQNMQTQLNNLATSNQRLESMLGNFIKMNTASTSGTLPSNTVTNPKEDLKGITTRSGVAYKGPMSTLVFAIEDDPTSPEVDPTYYDPDGDILLLEAILNSDPSPPPPNQGNYFLETRQDLKICEANYSVSEPPEVELKDLPPHLEYAFLEGNDKLPVIIAKDLKNEEKAALIEVLKSHKRAIAWKTFDIKIMPLKMTTRSAGRPAAASQRGGTGGRDGRGCGRTRGRSGDQGNGGIDGQGGQVGGQAQVCSQGIDHGNGRNQNGDAVNDNIRGDVRNVIENNDRRGFTYKEFLACNPK